MAGGPGHAGRAADLTTEQAQAAMAEILDGAATPAQIAGFIVALRMKGETVDELAAWSTPCSRGRAGPAGRRTSRGRHRRHRRRPQPHHQRLHAGRPRRGGAGGRVCKHGNRAASSATGSADLLEALGVGLDLEPDGVAPACRGRHRLLLRPRFHPAMRHAGPARARHRHGVQLPRPAGQPGGRAPAVIGVADPSMAERMAGVLAARGSERVLVVHGDDGSTS